jgi:hypothetical protein
MFQMHAERKISLIVCLSEGWAGFGSGLEKSLGRASSFEP